MQEITENSTIVLKVFYTVMQAFYFLTSKRQKLKQQRASKLY